MTERYIGEESSPPLSQNRGPRFRYRTIEYGTVAILTLLRRGSSGDAENKPIGGFGQIQFFYLNSKNFPHCRVIGYAVHWFDITQRCLGYLTAEIAERTWEHSKPSIGHSHFFFLLPLTPPPIRNYKSVARNDTKSTRSPPGFFLNSFSIIIDLNGPSNLHRSLDGGIPSLLPSWKFYLQCIAVNLI